MMASNTAYGVVSHGQGSGGDDVAMYEMVGQSVYLQPPDPLQTIPLTTSSPLRDLLPSHTTLRTLPMMSLLIVKLTVTHYQEQPCGFVTKSVSISRTLLCFNIHIQQQLDVSLCSQSLWNSALH